MQIDNTRRSFLAAGALSVAPRGYARPAGRRLKLRVTNPDTPVREAGLDTTGGISAEFPVSVVSVANRRHVFISSGGAEAYTVPAGLHIIHDAPKIRAGKPTFAIGGFDFMLKRGYAPLTTPYDREKTYWRKNYCGTFNVCVMPADANSGEWVFSINHNENKNERIRKPWGTIYFHNSINRNDPAGPNTSSGGTPAGYRDYNRGYFGFVSMSYAPVTAETQWGKELYKHDMGPVLWPWTGFLTADGKDKHPQYRNPHPHPSSLIAEDPKDGRKYVYIFTIDSSTNPDGERMVKAARSPIESRGMPGSFLNLCRGEYTEPALPKNMNEGIAVLATRPGGRCDPIHPTVDGTHGRMNRFFVARLKRSGLFLSVETVFFREGGESLIESYLRLSEDLRTWTDRQPIPNTRVSSRQQRSKTPPFGMFYPKFLSADGSSHYEIDEAEPFYVIATKPHNMVHRELAIEIG